MDISVVVPTYNRRETVLRTLQTLFAQDFPPSAYEIIVVVDGSTDGTASAVRALTPNCRLVVLEQQNKGLAGARNTGFRAASSDLVIFLDDDMLCDPGLLAAHVCAHSDDATVAFGAIFLSRDSPRTLAAECFNRELGSYCLAHQKGEIRPWRITDCVFGNTSIQKRILEEHGGFDERFRMREDLELGLRIFKAGVQPKYVPEGVARQYYDKTSADLIRDSEAFAAADVLLAIEHPEERIEGHVLALADLPPAKRLLNRIVGRASWPVDLLCWPLCAFGEAFFSMRFARTLGVRALQYRRKAHWLSRVAADPRLRNR